MVRTHPLLDAGILERKHIKRKGNESTQNTVVQYQ
jgi:hypothetical protein